MFFIAIVLKFRMQQALSWHDGFYSSFEETTDAMKEPFFASTEFPLMRTLLPAPPHHLLLRLTWKCDAMQLTRLTQWSTSLRIGTPLRVGQYQGELESVQISEPPWSGISTWADFTAHQQCKRLRVAFITPVALTQANTEPFIFPEPVSVFALLYERWNALGGPRLSATMEELIAATRCVLSAYQLKTVKIQKNVHTLQGYHGWVEFEYRLGEGEAVATLNMLTRTMCYAGLGYYTDSGMGVATVAMEG